MPKLQHPESEETVVDVPEERAELLRDRGYSDVGGRGSDDRPNKSDSKDDWVNYAVSQGWDREAAEDATKDELYDEFS